MSIIEIILKNTYMRLLNQKPGILLLIILAVINYGASGQTGVLNPADPILIYNPANPPATPPANTLAKWVKTTQLSWNSTSYKCYYYNGIAFRLKFPKTYQHNVNDGKVYPLFLFFHGRGERGSIYDNEYQLYHGGELHKNAADAGKFDGFLLYPQTETEFWSTGDYFFLQKLITDYLVPQVKVDPYRIYVDGLSAGGSAAWGFMINYPKIVAACLPISASSTTYTSSINIFKFIPIWHFQGGLDASPNPALSRQIGADFLQAGCNYRYTEFPEQGHSCWYNAWGEPDYFPFMLRSNKLNPWALYGRTEFCAGDTINVTIGITAGFDSYQWRKNGVVLSGQSSNTLNVTAVGTYDCRVFSNNIWSAWSPVPVVIKLKTTTISPTIKVSGLYSKVIPAPDGSTGVPLEEPDGYETYAWQKEGDATILSSIRFFTAAAPASYKAQVTEKYGCGSNFSPLFNVIDANGINKPDAPFNVTATTLSKTSIRLDWAQTATPAFNETGFEIYQSSSVSPAYKLIKITSTNITTYSIINLSPGITYSYKLRAVNNYSASAVTTPVSATTQADVTPPTSPGNLHTGASNENQIQLLWDASADDVGVVAYDIFINGSRSYTTTTTNFTVYNLVTDKSYDFSVRARDLAGNVSSFSNLATGKAALSGLRYRYYEEGFGRLPNFDAATPVKTGIVTNITTQPKQKNTKYAFYWEGNINIPVAGTYIFRLTSDDGSKLYINTPYSYTVKPLINNDKVHTVQSVDGTIALAAGTYPIVITYFQKLDASTITLSWNTPQTNNTFTLVPDSAFASSSSSGGNNLPAPFAAYINYNVDFPAASPWNNTSVLPYAGFALTNLLNDSNNSTGVNMTLVTNFTGVNPEGMITGNNSGVYPDNVMRSSYYVDHGDTALLKIDGLNQAMLYKFTFFGSRDATGDRTTIYSIGSQQVSLNATGNISNTVEIHDIVPDGDGAVYITVYDPQSSLFGYLNSLVIEAYNPQQLRVRNISQPDNLINSLSLEQDNKAVKVFPNPFANEVTLQLALSKSVPKMQVIITDVAGRIIYSQAFSNITKGFWQQQLNVGNVLHKGIYFLQVKGIEEAGTKAVKIIKR